MEPNKNADWIFLFAFALFSSPQCVFCCCATPSTWDSSKIEKWKKVFIFIVAFASCLLAGWRCEVEEAQCESSNFWVRNIRHFDVLPAHFYDAALRGFKWVKSEVVSGSNRTENEMNFFPLIYSLATSHTPRRHRLKNGMKNDERTTKKRHCEISVTGLSIFFGVLWHFGCCQSWFWHGNERFSSFRRNKWSQIRSCICLHRRQFSSLREASNLHDISSHRHTDSDSIRDGTFFTTEMKSRFRIVKESIEIQRARRKHGNLKFRSSTTNIYCRKCKYERSSLIKLSQEISFGAHGEEICQPKFSNWNCKFVRYFESSTETTQSVIGWGWWKSERKN